MARLLAETTWGCNSLRPKSAVSILAVVLGFACSGCNRPAGSAAAAVPHEPKPAKEPVQAARTPPELVEVWVAARDLPVGTVITGEELPTLAVRKKLPTDALPPVYVANLEEFIDRPLTRLVSKNAPFDPQTFSTQKVLKLPEGMEVVALSLPATSTGHLNLSPGTNVDVLTTLRIASRSRAFHLLLDVQVIAIDSNSTNPPSLSVSFAMTQEQSQLAALAKQRDCKFEVVRRLPGNTRNIDYDIKRVAALLQDDQKLPTFLKTKADPLPTSPSSPEPIAAPRELMKVWVAVSDIPPKAVITRQLVDAKLKRINVSKERAECAIRDLTCLFDQGLTLELGLRQGQLLTASLVGRPQPAGVAESDEVEEAPMPRAVKPKKYKDVTIRSSNGVRIYRYEEVAPDQFKLVGVFTPDDGRPTTGRAVTPPKKGNR